MTDAAPETPVVEEPQAPSTPATQEAPQHAGLRVTFELDGDLNGTTLESVLAPFDLASRSLPAGVTNKGGGTYTFTFTDADGNPVD